MDLSNISFANIEATFTTNYILFENFSFATSILDNLIITYILFNSLHLQR